MSFAAPLFLWLMGVLAPLTAFFLAWAWKQKERAIGRFVRSRLLAQLTIGVSHLRQWIKSGLIVAGITFIFVALARPRWGLGEEIARADGIDIVVCVDVSRSMQATDATPSRLTRAKLACYDLLQASKSDRLGLVAFAGQAFLQCPLTLDDEAFRQNVAALDTDSIPEQGTALGGAIEEAKAAFGPDAATEKAIIVITDGEDHEPGAIESAKECAKAGIRIFTIGVGSAAGELLKTTDPYGNAVFFKDDEGNPVKSRLNEELLTQIAGAADGFYLHLQNTDTMGELYKRAFSNVRRTRFHTAVFREWIERFQWPLGLGILLLAMEILIPDHRRPASRPAPVKPKPGETVAAAVAAVSILLLAACPAAQASAGRAEADYKKGLFKEAQEEYEKEAKDKPADLRFRFNAGTAAYKAGDYKAAAGMFEQVLNSPDLNLQEQAWYNLGNSLVRKGEETKEADEKRQQWTQAMSSYTAAQKLNPQDADAKRNYDWVKRKLEKLPPPAPEQQNQQDQKKDSKQDEKKQSDQKNQQQSSNSKDQNQQQKENPKSSDPKQSQSKDQSQKDGQQKQDASQKKDGEKKGDQQQQTPGDQQGAAAGDKSQQGSKNDGLKPQQASEEQRAAAQQAQAQDDNANQQGKMSERQALRLLDNQKGEEKAFVFRVLRGNGYTNGETKELREARRKAW